MLDKTDGFKVPAIDENQSYYPFFLEQNLNPHPATLSSLYASIPETVTEWLKEYLATAGWGYYWEYLLHSVLLEVIPVVVTTTGVSFNPPEPATGLSDLTPREYINHLLANEPTTVTPIVTSVLGLFSEFYKGGRPMYLLTPKFPGFTRLADI